MAGLILCRSEYAKKPFYISNVAVNIYSLEELCYYIYNNIYLIGSELVDSELIDYIRTDLRETELADQLDFLVSQRAGLSELVITILRYVDYYTEDEISSLKEVIDKLDTQNASERLKARADNFLSNKRYFSAIRNYELIVYGKRDKTLPDSFYGDTWHNMGTSFAGMFNYPEAAICFKTAYELNNNEASLKSFYAAKCMDNKKAVIDDEDEMMYVTAREIETLMDHAPSAPSYNSVRQAVLLKEEGKIGEHYELLNEIIENWKQEYRNYIK